MVFMRIISLLVATMLLRYALWGEQGLNQWLLVIQACVLLTLACLPLKTILKGHVWQLALVLVALQLLAMLSNLTAANWLFEGLLLYFYVAWIAVIWRSKLLTASGLFEQPRWRATL